MGKKYLLIGYYGQHNTGDDAFCVIGGWGIDHFWDGGKKMYLSKVLPRLVADGTAVLEKSPQFPGSNTLRTVMAILQADRIIFAGGSVFWSAPKTTAQKILYVTSRLKLKEFAAIGVSIGPFASEEALQWVKKQLQNFKFISLRDQTSYDAALQLGLTGKITRAFDLALLLPNVYGKPKSKQRKEKILGVSICHYERYVNGDTKMEKKREDLINFALEYLSQKENLSFKLFVFNGHPEVGDHQITHDLYYRLINTGRKVEIVEYNSDPRSTWEEIQQCSALFGVRLHSGIFAYAANTPFMLVEYHNKCSDFLNEIGYPQELRVDINEDTVESLSGKIMLLLERDASWSTSNESACIMAAKNFLEAPWTSA